MEDGDDDISVTADFRSEDDVASPENSVSNVLIRKSESKQSSESDFTVSSTKHDREETNQDTLAESERHISSSDGEGDINTTLEEDLLESQDEDDGDRNDHDELGFDIAGEEEGQSDFADEGDPNSSKDDAQLSAEEEDLVLAMDLEEEEEGEESVCTDEDKGVKIGVQDEGGERAVSSEETDEEMQDSFIDSEGHSQELEKSNKDLEGMELSESDVHAASNDDDMQAGSEEESESNIQIVSRDASSDIQTASEEDGDQDVEMCSGTTSDPKVVDDDLSVPICSDEEQNILSPAEDTDNISQTLEKEDERRANPIVEEISEDSESEYTQISTGGQENEPDGERCESMSSPRVETETLSETEAVVSETVESQKVVETEKSDSSSLSEGDGSGFKEKEHGIDECDFEKEAQDNCISTVDADIRTGEDPPSDEPELCSPVSNNGGDSEACKIDEMLGHTGRDSATLTRDDEQYIPNTETEEKDSSSVVNNIQSENKEQMSDSILSPQCKEFHSEEIDVPECEERDDNSDTLERSENVELDEMQEERDFLKTSSDEWCSSEQCTEQNYELEGGEKGESACDVDNEHNYEDISTRAENQVNGELELEKNQLVQAVHNDEQSTNSREKGGVKRKHEGSPLEDSYTDATQIESTKESNHFKGFKKRYIAQVSGAAAKEESAVPCLAYQEPRTKGSKSPAKKLIVEAPQMIVSHQALPDGVQTNTPLTEYAQYLGLQPTVKFKCYKCGESGFPSMLKLKEHQSTCLKNFQIQPFSKPSPTPVEMSPSTNFRITRKVYLCSACGTYYENWNLFLHMREVHKRHTCLFCLTMFSQADKLADHLSSKHGVIDNSYSSPEHFLSEFKGSFFVMCCGCEQLFTERDHFFDHACGATRITSADQACSLCGLKGAHFPTCRRAFTDSCSSLSNQTTSVCTNSEIPQNSHAIVPEKTISHTKSEKGTRKVHNKLSEQKTELGKKKDMMDIDDQYDISDAASYCHVNIVEPEKQNVAGSKGKSSTKGKIVVESHQSPAEKTPSEELKENENTDDSGLKEMENQETKDSPNSPASTDVHCSEEGQSMQKAESHATHIRCEEENEKEVRDVPSEERSESKESTSTVGMDSVPQTKPSPKLSPKPNAAKGTAVNADSESESSDSAVDSRDSDGSSSSSDASSDENEQEEKADKSQKEIKGAGMSEESDGEKSDSDKMSIVVDEAPDEDAEEQTKKDDDDQSSEIKEAPAVNESEGHEENETKCSEDISVEGTEEKPAVTPNEQAEEHSDNIQIAGDDVPLLELTLEQPMELLSIQTVVKECVKISCSTCVYCNHAKRIAVNGKQLVLHLLAEHRFETVVCSDSGELTPVDSFADKMKGKLVSLQDMYFNTDTYDNTDKDSIRPFDRTYECFQCHFITTLHKELYLHNRKMHQKTILICIMCKSNFYSYSELLCHLCPGIYVPDSNILFRCCLCVVDGLPSAFRLMVHLRKRHHACDVCLETTGDQQKLSNHVWKHKLHHLCYRCGIAYRNKPDITKHLFWKHGTESVLCKKCLQKKWPHVYHFCIPPTAFLCEECNTSFSRAVSLKVHKRLHAGDVPYSCEECNEKFISKKLLKRHKEIHNPNINVNDAEEKQDDNIPSKGDEPELQMGDADTNQNIKKSDESSNEDLKEQVSKHEVDALNQTPTPGKSNSTPEPAKVAESLQKAEDVDKKTKVVDVYDLPPLNLSSESDDTDDETTSKAPANDSKPAELSSSIQPEEHATTSEVEKNNDIEEEPVQIVDGVWDNFKTYKANLEKREGLQVQTSPDNQAIVDVVMADHDYCAVPSKISELASSQTSENTAIPQTSDSVTENLDEDKNNALDADHNYCFNTSPRSEEKNDPSLPIQTSSSPQPHSSPPHPPTQLPSTPPAVPAPNKKKQKSPKKKQKQSGSSSSSDSSSNSDSSSCTCGTNCSCSSSSSSSSGSSSSSSDSDSSSSEGRRRQAARRERRKERMKKKLDANAKEAVASASSEQLATPEAQGAGPVGAEHGDPVRASTGQAEGTATGTPHDSEETELLIHESDLDTTETETDEDFYDKYPQKQANKLLAEKRNQLLLLAAVAPVNNGTMAQPSPSTPETQEPIQKKKGKTKRHKKAQRNSSEKRVENKLKLNIPVSYYNNPSYSVTTAHSALPETNPQSPSVHASRLSHESFSSRNPETSTPVYHSTGSGSETESKRLSKRKRIPKRFYGDSSDEESEQTTPQPYKWRKVTPLPATNSHTVTQITHNVPTGFAYRGSSTSSRIPTPEPVRPRTVPQQEKSDDDDGGDESDSDHDQKRSSSDSSDSDSDNEQSDADSDAETIANATHTASAASGSTNQQKNENLYCYCQCPYDEVSEMIACDGKDCSIEWFHFECVGIMVPPKGKWFCPDCRKKTAVRSEYLLHA